MWEEIGRGDVSDVEKWRKDQKRKDGDQMLTLQLSHRQKNDAALRNCFCDFRVCADVAKRFVENSAIDNIDELIIIYRHIDLFSLDRFPIR